MPRVHAASGMPGEDRRTTAPAGGWGWSLGKRVMSGRSRSGSDDPA
ncbi:hypothetical protein MARPU_14010 [Marichromatium purpuratum 984]|uniref:Uncharacterized protein n=1 Tax=Marichromatium purpuratum 984 TaxID=765910 RepID=W0E8P5_MARPU|nr:hypothetical protein MARPU_14010 [Marichromatium purpuratum 984]